MGLEPLTGLYKNQYGIYSTHSFFPKFYSDYNKLRKQEFSALFSQSNLHTSSLTVDKSDWKVPKSSLQAVLNIHSDYIKY